MEERRHPSHLKTIVVTLLVLVLLTAASFWAAFHVSNPFEHDLETLFSVMAMFLMAAIAMVGALGTFVSKCPECNSWIRRETKASRSDEHIRFVCKKCDIVWDSGMTAEVDA